MRWRRRCCARSRSTRRRCARSPICRRARRPYPRLRWNANDADCLAPAQFRPALDRGRDLDARRLAAVRRAAFLYLRSDRLGTGDWRDVRGGVFGDRWDRRRTMIAADLLRAGLLLLLAVRSPDWL